MIRLPAGCSRTDTLLTDTTLVRSTGALAWKRAARVLGQRGSRRSFQPQLRRHQGPRHRRVDRTDDLGAQPRKPDPAHACARPRAAVGPLCDPAAYGSLRPRSEEHTSELQSLMRISYAFFCLKKKH